MEINVCQTEEQIKALAACANDIWNEYFISIISQEQIDYMVEKFQSYPALSKAIKEEGYTYFLAYEKEAIVGFCGIRIDKDRLFLSKLYVRKEMRGKHIASTLLQQAIAFANAHQLQAIYLTCNKFNTNSIQVYEHKGFEIIDAIQTDIGHGFIMDDYIMQLTLS